MVGQTEPTLLIFSLELAIAWFGDLDALGFTLLRDWGSMTGIVCS